MEFEWDEAKNVANVAKHGINLADVTAAFSGPMLVDVDDREDYGEDRWIGVGILRGIVVVVVFTEPAPGRIRLISARKASRHERRRFEAS